MQDRLAALAEVLEVVHRVLEVGLLDLTIYLINTNPD